jgi:hypothetical protein
MQNTVLCKILDHSLYGAASERQLGRGSLCFAQIDNKAASLPIPLLTRSARQVPVWRQMPVSGQKRRFDRAPPIPDPPLLADILGVIRHVRKVPILLQKSVETGHEP